MQKLDKEMIIKNNDIYNNLDINAEEIQMKKILNSD